MGIGLIQAEMLLFEHRHRPVEGELLTVSGDAVGLTPAQAGELFARTGTPTRPGAGLEADARTGCVSDRSFFAAFSPARLSALGAADPGGPVDASLEGRFDFIVDAGSPDSPFDPVTPLKNAARMLRPGGRLFLLAWSNSCPTAYLKRSPDWFHDYFAVNEFADCKVYVVHLPDALPATLRTGPAAGRARADLHLFEPLVVNSGQTGYRPSVINSFRPQMTVVVAEKGAASTWDHNPIQVYYRTDEWHKKTCNASADRFASSARPVFCNGGPLRGQPEPFSSQASMRLVASWEVTGSYRDLIGGGPDEGPAAGFLRRPA